MEIAIGLTQFVCEKGDCRVENNVKIKEGKHSRGILFHNVVQHRGQKAVSEWNFLLTFVIRGKCG